jgi:hypothetical protein
MAVYKRGRVWWMSFVFETQHIQEITKMRNKRDAEQVEAARRTELAKGNVESSAGSPHRPCGSSRLASREQSKLCAPKNPERLSFTNRN